MSYSKFQNLESPISESAIGQCFPFAVRMAKDARPEDADNIDIFRVVHGSVSDRWTGERTEHAWVVMAGNVYFDWQTSSSRPDGLSLEEFNELCTIDYTAEETLVKCLRPGHYGPSNEHNAR